VLRTDEPGSCADPDPDTGGCMHDTLDIAQAIDIARQNGARAINISLGGGGFGPTLRNAVERAAQAGIIIVISAGNDSNADPDDLALIALTPEAAGHVIIAGSVNADDQISDFSNRAGSGQDFYLAALGNRVRSFDETGTNFLYSGTSYSAPQVAAAVALLAQAFPNLSGADIVQLLFQSARDGGASGDDAIYGQGILDLFEAFQPQGQTSLAGSQEPVELGTTVTLSAPMGDASQTGMSAIVLDSYDRAFTVDLAGTVQRTAPQSQLASALAVNEGGSFATPAGENAVLAFTIDARVDGARVARLSLRGEDAERARVAAGMIAARLDASTRVAFAFSQSGDTVGAQLGGRYRPAFLVAQDASGDTGFASRPETSFAVRRDIAGTGVTFYAERGDALSPHDPDHFLAREEWRRSRYAAFGVAADRQWGGLRIDGGLSWLAEDETFLGARFSQALGGGEGASTLFADLGLRYDAGGGWMLGADFRHGWSRMDGSSAVLRGASLRSYAASADVTKWDAFSEGDRLSLRIAQPLRVYAGGLRLTLPTSYDYATLAPTYENRFFNLAPRGRQVDVEAAYARPLGGGWLTGHIFYRRDPGHYAGIDDDMGAALRFTLGF
jgi:hypothetical protein